MTLLPTYRPAYEPGALVTNLEGDWLYRIESVEPDGTLNVRGAGNLRKGLRFNGPLMKGFDPRFVLPAPPYAREG